MRLVPAVDVPIAVVLLLRLLFARRARHAGAEAVERRREAPVAADELGDGGVDARALPLHVEARAAGADEMVAPLPRLLLHVPMEFVDRGAGVRRRVEGAAQDHDALALEGLDVGHGQRTAHRGGDRRCAAVYCRDALRKRAAT